MSGFTNKYKVHSLLIASRRWTEIQLSIQDLLILKGKPTKNGSIGTVKHDWTSTVWQWPIGNIFQFALGNI